MGPIFFSPGDSHTKGKLFPLHPSLEGVTEFDTDPKEGFVSFKVTTCNESSLFVPLQGIAADSSWLGDAFLKDYKNIYKIKMRETKKNNAWRLNCIMAKIERDGENKTKTL